MTSRPLVLLVSGFLLLSTACRRPGGGGDPSDSFDRRAMLANIAHGVILPSIEEYEREAVRFAEATDALVLAVGTTAHAAALVAARSAWSDSMEAWQAVEVFQLGPAADDGAATGALGIRDEIYSWPTVSPCGVDQAIVANEFGEAGFFDASLVNVVGLAAAEYLLYHDGPDNACAPQIPINEDGTWDALGDAEVTARRAAYADAIAGELVEDAGRLLAAWSPDEGNFVGTLSSAGLPDFAFGSAQEAVDELFAAIFYVELEVKDRKLGIPTGVHPDCPAETCPDRVESPWSGRAVPNITANLRSFRRAFLGGETAAAGIGFDDFLVERGAADLAAGMEAAIDAAILAVEAIPGASLEAAIVSDLDDVVAAHTAVKAVTDDLKSRFVTVLDLRVPDEGAGDND